MSYYSNSYHKLFAAVLSATVATSAIVAVSPYTAEASTLKSTSFKDVKSTDYFYEAVANLASREIIKGYDDSTFQPNAVVTRAQASKILALTLGLDIKNVSDPGLKDVQKSDWFYGPVAALVKAGYVTGYDDKTFKPNESLTRAQMAKILVKGFHLKYEADQQNPFKDVKTGEWYAGYVSALLTSGITTGKTPNTFAPNESVKRGQMAAFVFRSEGAVKGKLVQSEVVNITDSTLELKSGKYTITDDLKNWITPSNFSALNGAKISVREKGGKVASVESLEITAQGSASSDAGNPYKNHVLFDGKGAVISGDLKISGDYVSLKDVTVKGDLVIGKGVQNSLFTDGITVEGKTIISDVEETIPPAKESGNFYKSLAFRAPTLFAAASDTQPTIVFMNATMNSVEVMKSGITIQSKGSTKVESFSVNSNVVLQADEGVVIPKVIVQEGAEKVTIDAAVDSLVVNTKKELTVSGSGSIKSVSIESEKPVTLATEGKIDKIETTTKDAKISLGENTKVDNIVLPDGTDAKDVIQNYEQVKEQIDKVDGEDNPDAPPTPIPPSNGGGNAGGGSTQAPRVTVSDIQISNSTTVTFVSDRNPTRVTWNDSSATITSYNPSTKIATITVPAIKKTANTLVVDAAGYRAAATDFSVPVGVYGDLKVIGDIGNLNEAIAHQADDQTWIIKGGTYNLPRTNVVGTDEGDADKGAYLNISADNLTIIGDGNPTITTEEVGTGNWQDQQLVVVKGNDVTLYGVNLIGNVSKYDDVTVVNKIIEVFGDGFTFKNSNVSARNGLDGGTIYYSTGEGKTSTIENVTLDRGRISLSGASDLNLTLRDVNINFSGNSSESDGFLPIYKLNNASTVTAENVVATVSEKSAPHLQKTLDNLPDGATLKLDAGTYELDSQIRINKAINMEGSGDSTIITTGNSAWTNTMDSKGYASLITIMSGEQSVKLDSMKVMGAKNITLTNGTDYGSGINIVSSGDVSLNNITSIDNAAAGLIVNSSTVEANNLNTSGNEWYGVNVDKADSGDAKFTLTGNGILNEPAQIVSDTEGNVIIDANGYNRYKVDGYDGVVWNKSLSNVASITDTEGAITLYTNLQKSINAAGENGTVHVWPGTYGLSEQLNITKPVSIIGEGDVTLQAANDSWSTENGEKHLLSISAGTEKDPVSISNIKIDGNNKSHGVNTYANAYGILNDVTITNGLGAGLTINGSTIIANNLQTDGNNWGAVNVDPGSGVSTPSNFTLTSGTLNEDNQIWSDGHNVSGNAMVNVNATGFHKYILDGNYIWTNKSLSNVASITDTHGETTLYSTIQAAVDAAVANDTVHVAAGTYELTNQLQITKPITIIGTEGVTIKPASGFIEGSQSSDNNLIAVNGVSGTVTLQNFTVSNSRRSGINIWESADVKLKDIVSQNNTGAGLVVNNSVVIADNFNTNNNDWGYGVNVDNGSSPSTGAPLTSFTLNSGTLEEDKDIVSDKGGVEIIAPNYAVFIKDAEKVSGATITSWYGENDSLLDTSVNINFDELPIGDIDSIKFSLYNNGHLLGTKESAGADLENLLKDCAVYWGQAEGSYLNVSGTRTMSAAFMNRTDSEDNGYWKNSISTAQNTSIPNGLVVEVVVGNVTYLALK